MAEAHAMDRAAYVGPISPAAPRCAHGLDCSRDKRLAAMEIEVRDTDARGSLFDSGSTQPGAPERAAACGYHCRNRAGVGHELVLRYRELGGGDVEFLGGITDRHLA